MPVEPASFLGISLLDQLGSETSGPQDSASSKRNKKKADKRERIRLAARRLFAEFGYDDTTMRDVAVEAKVALGTISLYAADKRDLTLMVFNHQMEEMLETSKAMIKQADEDLVSQMMAFFEHQVRSFYTNMKLSHVFFQLNYFPSGLHGAEYVRLTGEVLNEIRDIVHRARERGEVRSPFTDDMIAVHLFLTFTGTIRFWVAQPRPNFGDVIEGLRSQFELVLNGLKSENGAAPKR